MLIDEHSLRSMKRGITTQIFLVHFPYNTSQPILGCLLSLSQASLEARDTDASTI